jgi:nicotinamidase-related amidase
MMKNTALLLCDLQNDFLHPDGAYARANVTSPDIAVLPQHLTPLVDAMRAANAPIIATLFTLVPSPSGPLIAPHLAKLRPFLKTGDFAPNSWGQRSVIEPDYAVEKIAYSAFYNSRLEWLLRRLAISKLLVAGIVTNGGVSSTVRDAAVRDFSCTILSDGCAAFDPATHEAALAALRGVAEISTIEGALKQCA